MLNCDLFKILAPVFLETYFLFAFRIKFGHDIVKTGLESALELQVILITSPDDCFVMQCVLDLNLPRKLILGFLFLLLLGGGFRWAIRSADRQGASIISVGLKLLLKVNLENRWSEAGEFSGGTLREVGICIHGHQVLDILVLLFNDFIAR